MDTRIGEIVTEEKLPSRRTGAPDFHRALTGKFSLNCLTHERRQYMRPLKIKTIPWSIKVGRHCGKIFCSKLPVVGPTHFDSSYLGQRIGSIRRFKWTRKQVLLFQGLRG